MKNNRAGWLSIFTGLFLVFSGIILGNAVAEGLHIANGEVSMNKLVVDFNSSGERGELLRTDMIRELENKLEKPFIAYTVHTLAHKRVKDVSGMGIDAVVGGTGGYYPMFHHFEFRSGGYFPLTDSGGTAKIAVISEDVAWKLFRTVQATGLTLELYGEPFLITGVFCNGGDILKTIAKVEKPDIIIPAETMLELDASATIDSLEVAEDESAIFGGNKEKLLAALRQVGVDDTGFTITDFRETHTIMRQRPLLLVLAAGLTAILVWFRILRCTSEETVRDIRVLYSRHSLFQSLGASLSSCSRKLILPIAAILLTIYLWQRLSFHLYVPAEYLPGETLDVKQYTDLFKQALQQTFSGIHDDSPVSIRLLQASRLLSASLFRVSLTAGFGFCWIGMATVNYQRITRKSDIGQSPGKKPDIAAAQVGGVDQLMVKAGIGLIACISAASGLCSILGLSAIVPSEGILIIWSFTAACLIWYERTSFACTA